MVAITVILTAVIAAFVSTINQDIPKTIVPLADKHYVPPTAFTPEDTAIMPPKREPSARERLLWGLGKMTDCPQCLYCFSTNITREETRHEKGLRAGKIKSITFTCDHGHTNTFSNPNLIDKEVTE